MDEFVRVTVRTIGILTYYRTDRETAQRYERQMRRSVPGFHVVIDDGDTTGLPPIPCEHLFRQPLPREQAQCGTGS